MGITGLGFTPYIPTNPAGTPTPGNETTVDAGGTGATDGASGVNAVQTQGAQELDLHLLIEVDVVPGVPSALSVPQIPPPAKLGNLTTSDLIQLVRSEARKTSQELISATAEMIKSQKMDIQAKADAKIKQINENIQKQKEADEKKKAMDIFKYVMYAISAIILAITAVVAAATAIFTGGASMLIMTAIAAALLTATICATEIKDKDGKSGMDIGMEKMAEGLGKAFSGDSEQQKQKGGIFAASLMAALQVTIAIVMIAATFGSGAGSATSSIGRAVMGVIDAAVKPMMQAVSIVQAGAQIAGAGVKIDVAVNEYKNAVGKSQVEELKALIKMLEALLDQDMDFMKQLMEIQAKLDQGVSSILKNEHETSNKIADIPQVA